MTLDADVFDSEPVARLRSMFTALYPDHLPSRLNALGACAGFAAEAAVWRELVAPTGRNPGDVFVRSDAGAVRQYESAAASLFLLGAGPDHVGFLDLACSALADPAARPDAALIARHAGRTPASGWPRLPSFATPAEPSRTALERSWAAAAAILSPHRSGEWPALLGACAYTVIRAGRAALAPRLAVTILLEAAIPMSKLDPDAVAGSGVVIPPVAAWSARAAAASATPTIEAVTREAMPPRRPSLVRALGHIYRPDIAFVNLAGVACDDMVAEDHAAFGGIFGPDRRIATVPVPCDVLFLYCRFGQAGNIAGEHASLRGVIGETGARIAVVATELPGRPPLSLPALEALVAQGRHNPVNLVLTVNRHGELFGRFFRSAFERMRNGAAMPAVWAQLAPATTNPLHDVPATLCKMEAGHVAFSGMAA